METSPKNSNSKFHNLGLEKASSIKSSKKVIGLTRDASKKRMSQGGTDQPKLEHRYPKNEEIIAEANQPALANVLNEDLIVIRGEHDTFIDVAADSADTKAMEARIIDSQIDPDKQQA